MLLVDGVLLDTGLPCETIAQENSRSKPSLPSVQSQPQGEAQQQEPQPEQHGVTQEELEPHIPGAWIHTSQAVVLAPNPLDSTKAEKPDQAVLWEKLNDMIRKGDSMLASPYKATYKSRGAVKRRALLVGGQYEVDTRNVPLSGTPNDILNIYNVLRNHGYEEENIRVLVSGAADTSQYKCQPTRKNIMKSLDWLVQDAREDDYRYFHFSGHGEIFESPSGKMARKIPNDRISVEEDDTERYGDPTVKLRVASQTIRVAEIKRYNEALSAYCHDKPPRAQTKFDLVEWENCYRIRDQELNQIFSRLPEGCRLTNAVEYPQGSNSGGYFTSAFVEAVNDIPKGKLIKVGELFETVNAKVVDKMKSDMNMNMKNKSGTDPAKTGGANPQYIQLWTSLGKGTEHSARVKLDYWFVI
ncbi:unnamed protein product [Rhizoctonia solani]|uniref:Peptidase C14 caspase domain-containing protein n=1 Tax=Rhizoctonia solani TaxID=456999 RepID=A0A8H3D6Z7_9AGAM|nr:unnamed protein product [Rhizoctonia solani]